MGTRGPKSTAELALSIVPKTQIEPPDALADDEKQLFRETVASMPKNWFKPHDIQTLVGYCRLSCACNRIAAQIAAYPLDTNILKLQPYYDMLEKNTRAMFSAAVKLRLTPSTQYQAQKSRAGQGGTGAPKPWEFTGS
jgi:phage terminase small subunit